MNMMYTSNKQIKTSKIELVICLKDNIDGLPETDELETIRTMISKIEATQYTDWVDLMRDQEEAYALINKAWFAARSQKFSCPEME